MQGSPPGHISCVRVGTVLQQHLSHSTAQHGESVKAVAAAFVVLILVILCELDSALYYGVGGGRENFRPRLVSCTIRLRC